MVETEARVYFAIKTEDDLIEESTISNYIGLKPTNFFKMHEKGNIPKCTSWQISTDKIKNPCVHNMIDSILDILSSCRGNLIEFKKRYPQVTYVLEIVIEHGDDAVGLGFDNNQLCLLSEIGAFVDIDQYNYKD